MDFLHHYDNRSAQFNSNTLLGINHHHSFMEKIKEIISPLNGLFFVAFHIAHNCLCKAIEIHARLYVKSALKTFKL